MTEPRRRRKPAKEEKPIHEQFNKSANENKRQPRKIDTKGLIPTGITLLNCCLSDSAFGGFQKGKIATMPGPSQSGKSIVACTTFAACAHDKEFDNYDLIYDDIEEAKEFDTDYLFGEKTNKRVIAPHYDSNGEPVYSNTIQDLESNIIRRCNQGNCKPFIYIADTLDALTEEEEVLKEYQNAILRAKDTYAIKDIKEAFAGNKAYIIGRILRAVKGMLKKTGSSLIMVQQERTKMGATGWQKQYTTAGGKAPYYYSTHQVRLTNTGEIKDSGIVIGNKLKASVVKNKLNGKKRDCEFCVYNDLGVDDVASCVDFLCKNKYWKPLTGHPNTYTAPEIDHQGSKIKLIEHIESNKLEKQMQEAVNTAWNLREEEVLLGRQRRF